MSNAQIIDSSKYKLQIPKNPKQLILITCYPFDTFHPGGPLRYVVTLES